MIWKLAFRNIWRNKRRTLITSASVMFAGFLTITMSSIETGMWEKMLQNVIDQTTGQVQIQSKKFFDEPTLDNSFASVSYTHLRAHETVLDLVCRLLLEKKKNQSHSVRISSYKS